MKKLIYRLAALLFLITEDPIIWIEADGDESVNEQDDDPFFATFKMIDVLQYIIDECFDTWFDLITSPNVNPYTSPWFHNQYMAWHIANRDLDYPIDTMSPHHREWRRNKINTELITKGFE